MNIKSRAAFCAAVMAFTAAIGGISAAAATDTPDVIVYDKDNVWTQNTQIDLFERNELGNQLIYPGVTGQYSFTVSNIGSEAKECQVIIEDENKFSAPLDIRIKRDGAYVIGSSTVWAVSADYDSGIFLLDSKADSTYELEWKWDFEINDELNSRDTVLGKQARFENIPYNLKIEVFAETAPPESSDPSEPSEPSELSDPSQPSESSDPSQPSEPSEPSVPSQPSDPSQPSEPSVPSDLSTSTPSETSNPSEPDRSIPTAPDDPPITGDSTSAILPLIFALVSISAVIISTAKKRKSN